jgi:hypothetical protein
METQGSMASGRAARAMAWIFAAACVSPVLAQDSAPAQPDELDFQPPILQKIDVTGSVNAQALNQYVTVTVTVTDNLSGVASFLVDFRSPTGMHHVSRMKSIPLPRGKVNSEMTLGASPFSEPPFLRFAEPGTWTVYSLTASDAAGNTVSYNESQLNFIGGYHKFLVTNNGGYDNVPPTLASGTIETPTVRLSREPKGTPPGTPPYVNARVSMTDSGNGIISGAYIGRLMFCLAGSGSCQAGNTNTFTMSSIANRTGLTASTLTVGTQLVSNQLLGNYLIYSLEMIDVAGSHRKLISSDFSGGNINFRDYFPQGVAIFVSQ